MKSLKYKYPGFLINHCNEDKYLRWLTAKASAHVRRDKRRGLIAPSFEQYKIAIHKAVVESNGFDYYTGLLLDWSLIGSYDNNSSKVGKRTYKKMFSNLPTIDHVNDVNGELIFRICSWKVNDSKSDLSHQDFVELCKQVIKHNSFLGE